MMFFNRCFKAAEDPRQHLEAHTDKANAARDGQGVQLMVKSLLCLLIIAPPVFGQVAAPPPAEDHCNNVEPAEKLNRGLETFAGSTSCKGMADSAPGNAAVNPSITGVGPSEEGRQTKRILYIMPNFHSVSTGTHLPPQSAKEKLMNATQDSFDYSGLIFVGMLAGVGQAQRSTPEFGQGAAGYGRYYWHSLADQSSENYLVEGFLPIVLRQDTRYYTLGRGGFFRRSLYATSRAAITRTDAGASAPNYSEIIGAGAAAGISNLYYPEKQRTWTKTGQRWATEVSLDVLGQLFREFWPDVNRKVFHQQ